MKRSDIDNLVESTDMVAVIGKYVDLKKSGTSTWKGKSPFQEEKTPSFYVKPDKGFWKDFSSGKGGDVIGFLMEKEGLTFPEALDYLAAENGIEIDRSSNARSEDLSIYDTNNKLQEFFLSNKDMAWEYYKVRGIQEEWLKAFGVGSCTASIDKSGVEFGKLQHSGHLTSSGAVMYAGRITVPIRNKHGQVIAFGGRVFGDNKPKWVNTSENKLFVKSSVLYGLDMARPSMSTSNECIVVEGYSDVWAMHQGGYPQTVASMGTALSDNHLADISKICRGGTLYFATDGDQAGLNALLKSIPMAMKHHLNLGAIIFPEGEDPHSFIVGGGKPNKLTMFELIRYLKGKLKIFEFLAYFRLLRDEVNKIDDELIRMFYLNELKMLFL